MIRGKSKNMFCRSMRLLMLLVLLLSTAACGGKTSQKDSEVENMAATVEMKTTFTVVKFPEKLMDYMRREEVQEGNALHDVFYMVRQNREWEIFRVIYGDENIGTHVGYLETDSGEISVSYVLSQYTGDDFAEDKDWEWYYTMMDSVGVVLSSIQENEGFREGQSGKNIGSQQVSLRYWNLTLPTNVQYAETEEKEIYRIDFYGQIDGESVNLYTIVLGDLEVGTVLGCYDMNGKIVPVMIETCDVTKYDYWADEEKSTLYQMMDSLNDVINQIMSSEFYSEPSAE